MVRQSCLLAALLVLAPLQVAAQSIYHPEPARTGQRNPAPLLDPRAPRPGTPAGRAQPAKPPVTAPGGKVTHRPLPRQPIPPGRVVAPPGSLVRPPSPGRPTESPVKHRRRLTGVTRCNQQQIDCNRKCNTRTMGMARTLCYRQCYSKFLHCANVVNDLR